MISVRACRFKPLKPIKDESCHLSICTASLPIPASHTSSGWTEVSSVIAAFMDLCDEGHGMSQLMEGHRMDTPPFFSLEAPSSS